MGRVCMQPFFMDIAPQSGSTVHVFDVTSRTNLGEYPARPFLAQLVIGKSILNIYIIY